MTGGTETRPPIPASLANRPVAGGLALPWVNSPTTNGHCRYDFRIGSPHLRQQAGDVAEPDQRSDMKTVLLRGKNAGGRVALVDDADYELVAPYSWRVAERIRNGRPSGPYAHTTYRRNGRQVGLLMHKLITGWPQTDHRNHDGLDNQRSNLRPASGGQNHGNQRPTLRASSRWKGVSWDRQTRRWRATIRKDGACRHLGRFGSEEDAARAYDAAAREVFGEFACLNFPELPSLNAGEIQDLALLSQRRVQPRVGSAVGTSKLNEDQVRAIKRRSAAGEQGKSLAASFGVSPMAISDIVTGKKWRHVD